MKSTSFVLGPSFAMMLMIPLFGGCAVDASTDVSDDSEASYEEEETGTAELAILNCATNYTHPPATKVVKVAKGGTTWGSGVNGDGTYEIYLGGAGTGSMTLYDDMYTFKATWNNPTSAWGNFLGRSRPTKLASNDPDKFSFLKVGYKVNLSVQSGYSMVGVYGWSKNDFNVEPLRELYIIDNWTGARPTAGAVLGTFAVDGGTYDIYKAKRENADSIEGKQTFWQYFSVRTAKRSCGHIDILAHFNKWKSLGFQIGKLDQVNLLAESHSGPAVGTADFQYANFAQGLK